MTLPLSSSINESPQWRRLKRSWQLQKDTIENWVSSRYGVCLWEYDISSGGWGVDAYPRLTTGTPYRAADSATPVKEARQILASTGFSVSLSSTPKPIARAAFNQNVITTTKMSLSKKIMDWSWEGVLNPHWLTTNITYRVDTSQGMSSSLLSKGAEAIIPGDIVLELHPGLSRRKWYSARLHSYPNDLPVLRATTHGINEISMLASSTTVGGGGGGLAH